MLETKIELLTAAVMALTARLDSLAALYAVGAAPSQEPTATPKAEPAAPPVNDTAIPVSDKIDRDDLKAMALTLVREKGIHKDTIKKMLDAYGVKTITDLPDSALAEVKVKLVSLWD